MRMKGGEDWKARSPRGMAIRLLFISGLCVLGVYQIVKALLTGRLDWPGRGTTHVTWASHPIFFVAAVAGWLLITVVMAQISIRGSKRVLWLLKHP